MLPAPYTRGGELEAIRDTSGKKLRMASEELTL